MPFPRSFATDDSIRHNQMRLHIYRSLTESFRQMCLLTFCAALTLAQAPASQSRADSLVQVKIHSPALEGNKLGDPTDQKVLIYLPPSYASSTERRFATLYLLHGSTARPEIWTDGDFQGMNLPTSMDQLIAAGIAREMIVVMPNGSNKYLSSFYTNSIVTGNWEDYIVRDVVNYVDNHYRTIARPASHGIAGQSMGGYGSLMLAMKHPDIFGAVYALSPCCVAMKADLTSENPAWHSALAAPS
jgi:S-formylglutathione hydrolase FrmB